MIGLILAATLTVTQALYTVEKFCANAGLDIPKPLTEKELSKQILDTEHQRFQGRIGDKYRFTYYKGRIQELGDRSENIHVRLTRLDPADMQKWSEQPCPIDNAGALQIAQGIFKKLGFDEKRFDAPEVKRYRWIPSPANPQHVLWLPVYGVRWYQKGYSRELAVPAQVHMDISGTTQKIIYYFDSSK
jgi:hypothetical protein